MSLCWLPKRSLLLDEDYSRLSLFAESRGERVLQFARSSERGKRVSGSSDARTWRSAGGDVEPRHLNHGPKSSRQDEAAHKTASNGSEAVLQVSSGEPISPADSKISSKWALAHIKFFFGGK